ncbi:hypothetical protein E2C01_042793 [Portunus trituberculatus]|uniref:Uncharacterized protein n=1 Tax=Portunus trituberculatus TaxID=210409 RepID=A0A5B7FTY5_PORTR|nr:hypothetical protein [Portunus trituberculatus]
MTPTNPFFGVHESLVQSIGVNKGTLDTGVACDDIMYKTWMLGTWDMNLLPRHHDKGWHTKCVSTHELVTQQGPDLYQNDDSHISFGSSPPLLALLSGQLANFWSFVGLMLQECQGSSDTIYLVRNSDNLVQIQSAPQQEAAVFKCGFGYNKSTSIPITIPCQSFSAGGLTVPISQSFTSDPLKVI